MRNHTTAVSHRRGEQGFTLIEALIAMLILIVGIAAISNLIVVAGTSNTVANSTTAASAVASQQMELLKTARYNTLVAGGTMVVPPNHTPHLQCNTGLVTAVYACDTNVPGVGSIHVQWEIVGPLAGAVPAGTVFINLLAQPVAPGIGIRGRARFTTFRTDLG